MLFAPKVFASIALVCDSGTCQSIEKSDEPVHGILIIVGRRSDSCNKADFRFKSFQGQLMQFTLVRWRSEAKSLLGGTFVTSSAVMWPIDISKHSKRLPGFRSSRGISSNVENFQLLSSEKLYIDTETQRAVKGEPFEIQLALTIDLIPAKGFKEDLRFFRQRGCQAEPHSGSR
jgi:hypothetical protein